MLSVSTVRRQLPPPFVERNETMLIGPVSFVLLPFSGYSDATITAVPFGSTVPPFG